MKAVSVKDFQHCFQECELSVQQGNYFEEDEKPKPILHASRSLIEADKSYSQIEKEALAIKFSMKKFNKFLHCELNYHDQKIW